LWEKGFRDEGAKICQSIRVPFLVVAEIPPMSEFLKVSVPCILTLLIALPVKC
jgi:hypothetical protein